MNAIITTKKAKINQLCKEYGVKELYAFGSVVRDDFKFYSDVDLLVKFKKKEDNFMVSDAVLWLREEFAYLFKRPVDLHIYKVGESNKRFFDFIKDEKKIIYGGKTIN